MADRKLKVPILSLQALSLNQLVSGEELGPFAWVRDPKSLSGSECTWEAQDQGLKIGNWKK